MDKQLAEPGRTAPKLLISTTFRLLWSPCRNNVAMASG
ncbi:hypothetical protein COLO4_17319 [Corchorus olitorius]|uniref:Uncharacterized protein n=1 Tax=Corchorus olitorius TaxID=93759 RepID=A0A1R3JD71_9ROSI|nr:hypothetical protein COLO4_17319 [Corchorus olitorius]